jgi:hypothetical protein
MSMKITKENMMFSENMQMKKQKYAKIYYKKLWLRDGTVPIINAWQQLFLQIASSQCHILNLSIFWIKELMNTNATIH